MQLYLRGLLLLLLLVKDLNGSKVSIHPKEAINCMHAFAAVLHRHSIAAAAAAEAAAANENLSSTNMKVYTHSNTCSSEKAKYNNICKV